MTTEQKFVDVNGVQVMDLTPDLNRKLALVDLDVLIRLTSDLGKTNAYSVKRNLINELREVDTDNGKESLQTLVHIASEFVAFHKTVNLIQEINHPLNAYEPSKQMSEADLDEV